MKRIVLVSLPYWSPLVPPTGLAALKSFLEKKNYKVQIIDLNTKSESLKFYYDFFDVLKNIVPDNKKGTFYNIGHEVMRTALMVHFTCDNNDEYYKIVKKIINKWFYIDAEDNAVQQIYDIINEYLIVLKEYTKYLVEYYDPYLVGASIYKTNIPLSLFFFKFLKSYNDKIKTVVGGGAFVDFHSIKSENFDELLTVSKNYIDKFIVGPGEKMLLDLLEGRLDDSSRVYPNKYIYEDFSRCFDFSDFNMRKYSHVAATSSVSCPFKCSFCNEFEFWGKYKKRDINVVIQEMSDLYKIHRRQMFFMSDSLLNPTINELASKVIENKLPFFYDTYFRIDEASAKIENTSKWRNGGLYRVRLGVESGSQKILDLMNKQITVDQIKASISSLAYVGIKTTTYWVIGHPGETEDDFQMTLDLVSELKDDIWQAECNVFQYFYSGGQNSDGEWASKKIPLYSDDEIKYIKFKEWELDIEPKRDVIFERMHRFINHCKKLGIPNPYSSYEIWDADSRWKKLHKNAVPAFELISTQDTNIRPCELKVMAAKSIISEDIESFNL